MKRLTVKELKQFIKNIPDDTEVGTLKFNGQTYHKGYILDKELTYKDGDKVFYINLGF